jgi:hypothetical protein
VWNDKMREQDIADEIERNKIKDKNKQLTPRDFAGALGHAETAIKFAIQYLEKKNYFDALRILKDTEKKIEVLAPMDLK